LFINSNFDASGSIASYNPFNYVSVSVGRFKKIKSFTGSIAELFVFFYPMDQAQIEQHYKDGLNELENGDGTFLKNELEKDEAEYNRQTFATEKKIPNSVLKEVEVSSGFFKIIKEEPTHSELNDIVDMHDEEVQTQGNTDEVEALQNLDAFIFENPLIANEINEIANNFEWILKAASIMSTGDINKDGALELTRFMKILKFCKIKLPKSVVWEMIEITKTGTEILSEIDDTVKFKGVLYYYFLKIVKEVVFSDMMSHLADEEVEKVSVGHFSDSDDHVEEEEAEGEEEKEHSVEPEKPVAAGMRKDSFHSSPDKFSKVKSREGDEDESEEEKEADKTLEPVMPEGQQPFHPAKTIIDEPSLNEDGLIKNQQDENFVLPEPDQEVEEEQANELAEEQDDESLPELDDDWNTGHFVVNIIRCSGCHNHFDYCRHSEDEYINAFNDMGNDIIEKFPEAEIIGNHEKATYLG
jgi:hypothetical protein